MTMRLLRHRLLISLIVSAALSWTPDNTQAQTPLRVASPDDRNTVTVDVHEGALRYYRERHWLTP